MFRGLAERYQMNLKPRRQKMEDTRRAKRPASGRREGRLRRDEQRSLRSI